MQGHWGVPAGPGADERCFPIACHAQDRYGGLIWSSAAVSPTKSIFQGALVAAVPIEAGR